MVFLLQQTLLLFLLLQFGTSHITISKPIRDGDVLVSRGETFALGFFSPGKSTYRYVGIWYKTEPQGRTVVWVANRDSPINDTSGVLSIDSHGNLVLNVNYRKQPVWSTNIASKSSNKSTNAQLLDTGNLILIHNETTSEILWQSFDYPTDTTLPNMKLGLDRVTGLSRIVTSWKSKDDPGSGNCSFMLDTDISSPELFLYKGNIRWWRSGHWIGHGWGGLPPLIPNSFLNLSFVNNKSEVTTTWGVMESTFLARVVVQKSGSVQKFICRKADCIWFSIGSVPLDQCDYYNKCGTFGKCHIGSNGSDFKCMCLPGFMRNETGWCVRKRGEASLCRSGEGFVKVESVKVPDSSLAQVYPKLGFEACEPLCLQNCSCTAYASVDVEEEMGCMIWFGDLMDTRVLDGGQSLYVRVDALELDNHAKGFFANKRRLAILVVALLVTSLLIFLFVLWLIKWKRTGRERQLIVFNDVTESSTSFQDSHKLDESRRTPNLLFFDISIILAATDNFSPDKRLGQGGFGPVYKGQLANGQEIAIKTLSRSSRQGIKEFKNEVMLIAKLQHRNLVRLLGCCIHKEEKMLIYEYMPNKSLDFFIFDAIRRQLLDWSKRFEIISGIARGVLYLHQDSRLKIIHRDLKASNVLLDAEMNPKISDFGLARMFGDDQIEANTNRVVGTYGYMSPEYAMEGLYSTKSDVFSYGVLILEIISGKRNNHYHVESPCLNLIGHVWDLWEEGKPLDIVDSSLGQAYFPHQVSKCIHIGLLCVQEQAPDRPSMAEILFMLGNETSLPPPNKPAFINRKNIKYGLDSTSSVGATASLNDLTFSVFEAR
ncbi:hypothetical protein ACJW31_05G192700 [Castanea mollissima]